MGPLWLEIILRQLIFRGAKWDLILGATYGCIFNSTPSLENVTYNQMQNQIGKQNGNPSSLYRGYMESDMETALV